MLNNFAPFLTSARPASIAIAASCGVAVAGLAALMPTSAAPDILRDAGIAAVGLAGALIALGDLERRRVKIFPTALLFLGAWPMETTGSWLLPPLISLGTFIVLIGLITLAEAILRKPIAFGSGDIRIVSALAFLIGGINQITLALCVAAITSILITMAAGQWGGRRTKLPLAPGLVIGILVSAIAF